MRRTSRIPVAPMSALAAAGPIFDPTLLAGHVASSSVRIYAHDIRAYLAYAGTPTAALDPATLARWRTHLATARTVSPRTINRMLSAVKRLLREAATHGYVSPTLVETFDQVGGVKIGEMKACTRPAARTRVELAAMRHLCDAPDPATLRGLRDRALLATLASSGLRIAELASLTLGQILHTDGGHLLWVGGKSDTSVRDAPLSREAYHLIMVWLDARPVTSPWLFTSFAGRGQRATAAALSGVAIWRIVQHYAASVGLCHITPHDFRRFVGTQLAARDRRTAQQALGHKRLRTTARQALPDRLAPGLTDDLY